MQRYECCKNFVTLYCRYFSASIHLIPNSKNLVSFKTPGTLSNFNMSCFKVDLKERTTLPPKQRTT